MSICSSLGSLRTSFSKVTQRVGDHIFVVSVISHTLSKSLLNSEIARPAFEHKCLYSCFNLVWVLASRVAARILLATVQLYTMTPSDIPSLLFGPTQALIEHVYKPYSASPSVFPYHRPALVRSDSIKSDQPQQVLDIRLFRTASTSDTSRQQSPVPLASAYIN